MNFTYSEKCQRLSAQVQGFMDTHILPRLPLAKKEEHERQYPLSFMADLKALARAEGLWNLFLPALRPDEPGTGLSNLDYAPLAEIMGRVAWASEVFNCSAPDTGNMELLHIFARTSSAEQWLNPC